MLLLCPGVTHAAAVKVGSFAKSTGAAPVAQAVAHGLGEVPKAIIFWTTGNTSAGFTANFHYAFGMTDGTTSGSAAAASVDGANHANCSRRLANKALTVVQWNEVLVAEADLQSWDATNFTLNWTTNDASATIVHFIAIGGAGVSAKVVNWTMPTAAGTKAVAGVGFMPDVVIHAHAGFAVTASPPVTIGDGVSGLGVMTAAGNQWANTFLSDDPSNVSNTQRYQRTNRTLVSIDVNQVVQQEASFSSMDANGFTVNVTTASGTASQVYSLALKGVAASAGTFAKTTAAAPAAQAITGLGFRPRAVLLSSFQDVTGAAAVTETRFGLGASDGTTAGSIALVDADGQNFTVVSAMDKTTKTFVKVNNSTPAIDAEADLTSLDASGFTLSWTTNDAVATEMLYLALTPRRRVRIS